LAGRARVYDALGLADSALAAATQHDESVLDPVDVPMVPELLAQQRRFVEATRASSHWVDNRLVRGNVQGAAVARLQLARILLDAGDPIAARDAARGADTLALRMNLTDVHVTAARLMGVAAVRAGAEDGVTLL